MAVEFSLPADVRLRVYADGSSGRVFRTVAQLRRRRGCRGGGWRFGFCRRRGFRQMFLNVFAGQTTADASAFDGRWVKVVFSQQTTDRRAQRVVVLLFQRGLLTLRRSGRFRIGFLAAFFTCAVAFAQAAKIWRDRTVAPSSSSTASRMPSADAGTSSTTLSVSISTRTSSRTTASPGFCARWRRLRQLRTQAGREPEYLRYSLCIL